MKILLAFGERGFKAVAVGTSICHAISPQTHTHRQLSPLQTHTNTPITAQLSHSAF